MASLVLYLLKCEYLLVALKVAPLYHFDISVVSQQSKTVFQSVSMTMK